MPMTIANVAKGRMLQMRLNKLAPQDLVLRLYSNDRVPAVTDVAGDYTEVTGSGYAAITLDPDDWTVTEASPATAELLEQVVAFAAAVGNVYGYFVTEAVSGILFGAERFSDGPYDVQGITEIGVSIDTLDLTDA
jgi:hypothetical protein